MNRMVIITGASSGLGKAIADLYLSKKRVKVLSISRRITEDQKNNPNLIFHKCDFGNIDSIDFSGIDHLLKSPEKITLVVNAATIEPISKIGRVTKDEIIRSISINCTSVSILVNHIISRVNRTQNISIINLTSGASSKSIECWSLYSAGKAYQNRFFDILEKEQHNHLNVLQFDPGVMNTSMQEKIRSSEFPSQNNFRQLKKDDMLKSPEEVAKQIFERIE